MDVEKLWTLIRKIAGKAGRKVLMAGLTLWYCLKDSDTPYRIKALIMGDLVYLVSPLDAVPDVLPAVGFSDDLALLTATLVAIAGHIKPAHTDAAKNTVNQWLGDESA